MISLKLNAKQNIIFLISQSRINILSPIRITCLWYNLNKIQTSCACYQAQLLGSEIWGSFIPKRKQIWLQKKTLQKLAVKMMQ